MTREHARQPHTSVLAILTAAMAVGPLLSFSLGSVSAEVVDDLGISAAQYGLLATTSYAVAALASALGGRVAGTLSNASQVWLIFGISGTAFTVAAATAHFAWLVVAMAVAGLGQAFGNPSTTRWAAQYAPSGRQANWIAIKQSGQQLAQITAGLGFPILTLLVGWRGAAAVCAVITLLLGAVASALIPRGQPTPTCRAPHGSTKRRHTTAVHLFSLQSFVGSAGSTATTVYLPLFAVVDIGFPLVVGGLITATVGAIGILSRTFWARQISRGASADRLLVALNGGAILCAVSLTVSSAFGAPALLWIGVAIHSATALALNVVILSGVVREVPQDAVGSASGIVSVGMFAGISVGPLVMSAALATSDSFVWGWVIIGCVNALAMGIAVAVSVARRDRA